MLRKSLGGMNLLSFKALFIELLIIILFLFGCGKESLDIFQSSEMRANLMIKDVTIYDFGIVIVGTYVEHEFTLINIGLETATELNGSFYLDTNFSFKGGNYPGEGGTCSNILEPQQECTIVIRFTPKYSGEFNGMTTISYYDGNSYRILQNPTLRGQGTE